ncbi:MAG TPA: glycosyltransferase family 4 protein [Acidimicrobiales bacterium]|nr:glycosyltransferase family 4 protein [Acidimicrobiales bacterium]
MSRPGGVQGQVVGLARALRSLGLDVTVVAPDDKRPIGLDGDTYVVGRSTGLRSNGSVAPVALSPFAAARAERFTAGGDFDIVHLHEPLAPVVGYGCVARSPLPLVGTYHRSGDSTWYTLMAPVARWANARLSARTAVSEEAAATARAAMGGDYEVLFNGVEVQRFASAEPTPTDGPTVLFLGRHETRKGLEVLLDAFAQVPETATLWVAGDGPSTEGLRRRHPSSARLQWLGVLSDEEVARRLAGAHILCAPSRRGESFGMVLLEGMAARCVVVASDIPGYRDAAGGHAILVPPGDVKALAKALVETVAQVSLGTGRSTDAALNGASAHAADWSMGRLATRYAEIYQEAVGSGSPRAGQ